jgi:hypothetical protein
MMGSNRLKDLDVDGRTILKWVLKEMGRVNIDRIDLAQDRDQWRALVNTVMKLQIP